MGKNDVVYNRDIYDLINKRSDEIKKVLDVHGDKIQVLERWQDEIKWKLGSIAGIIGAITALSADWIKTKLGFK